VECVVPVFGRFLLAMDLRVFFSIMLVLSIGLFWLLMLSGRRDSNLL
jgi:hypothetical protein